MRGNYDNVAPFYDRFSKLVFGNALVESQCFLVNAVPQNSTILIVGGGTGLILEQLSSVHKSGLRITYVEASEKMLALSKKRNSGNNDVTFVHQTIQEFKTQQNFDIVATAFFFDNFISSTAAVIFNKVHPLLNPGGLWLYADFYKTRHRPFWQKLLLNMMYQFFRVFCNIEAAGLPDIEPLFKQGKYSITSQNFFFKKFVHSAVYVKYEY